MSAYLLLLATLAWAAPDTGGAYCGNTWVADGTWTGDGCLVTPEPSEVCDHVFPLPACETWDAMVAYTLDPEYTGSWRGWLGTCPDGGHVVTGLIMMPESSTTLYFEPGGDIAGAVFWGGSLWTNGCCEGNLTKILLYGVPFECDFPDPYVPPPEPVDPGSPTVALAPPAVRGGCGCGHAAPGSPWWLLGLVAVRRRR